MTLLFPGSFDPFTLGHADLVERALRLADQVIIAVGVNEQKTPFQPVADRLALLRRLYAADEHVRVVSYSGLTADLAQALHADALLRGVRTVADYEYEMQMADINRTLVGIDTILLPARPELAAISSSMVRELSHYGRDITPFLPL